MKHLVIQSLEKTAAYFENNRGKLIKSNDVNSSDFFGYKQQDIVHIPSLAASCYYFGICVLDEPSDVVVEYLRFTGLEKERAEFLLTTWREKRARGKGWFNINFTKTHWQYTMPPDNFTESQTAISTENPIEKLEFEDGVLSVNFLTDNPFAICFAIFEAAEKGYVVDVNMDVNIMNSTHCRIAYRFLTIAFNIACRWHLSRKSGTVSFSGSFLDSEGSGKPISLPERDLAYFITNAVKPRTKVTLDFSKKDSQGEVKASFEGMLIRDYRANRDKEKREVIYYFDGSAKYHLARKLMDAFYQSNRKGEKGTRGYPPYLFQFGGLQTKISEVWQHIACPYVAEHRAPTETEWKLSRPPIAVFSDDKSSLGPLYVLAFKTRRTSDTTFATDIFDCKTGELLHTVPYAARTEREVREYERREAYEREVLNERAKMVLELTAMMTSIKP